jgi:general L-amino acid transport system substrate-binding protein
MRAKGTKVFWFFSSEKNSFIFFARKLSLKYWIFVFLFAACSARAGTVLDGVKKTGLLSCGVVTALNDETVDDTHGNLSSFGAEICNAVAAAVLGPKAKAAVQGYPSEALAYQNLQQGKIALIVGATPNPGLARRYGVAYLQPVFFDTQGLLVHKDRGIKSLRDLAGKQICFIGGTDAETRLNQAVANAGIKIGRFPFEEIGEMEAALVGGRCDAETHDASKLAEGRSAFHGRKNDFEILPDRLALDPLSPVVRTDDAEWARVVDWVTGALVQAEIDGVTRENAVAMKQSADVNVQTLLGVRQGLQWGLFLNSDWAFWAIEAVGNYGEVFDRTAGEHSPLKLERGLNRPWTEGGMLWAAPFR